MVLEKTKHVYRLILIMTRNDRIKLHHTFTYTLGIKMFEPGGKEGCNRGRGLSTAI
jgi:hypothetical protein